MNLSLTPPPCGCMAGFAIAAVAVILAARCWAAVIAAPSLLP